MHAAYRVIGPSAAGDRHFGVVFQRIFSASPGVPPALDRQRTARRRRRRERPYPRGLREGRLPGADEPGAPRAARVAAGGSPRADHARARHQLPLDRRLGAARGGLCGRASRRAPFPANSHPFTATRLVPGADVLAPGPAALPLPVGLLLRHRLRERRARRAPARNVRRLARARALPGDRVLAEQRDRPSQAWAARGRARAGRRGRRAAPQATTGASSSPSSSPRRSSRRPSSSTGATTSTASSSRPRSSSPWASSGAASRSRHPDRREGRRPAPAPARRPRPPRAGDEALPTPHVLSARPRRARDLDPRPSG